jgi:glycosyltransferase involved in cell wall biosynthesis
MKILHLLPAIASIYGGMSVAVPNLASALGIRGVHVDIVTTNANGADKMDFPLNQWIEEDGYRIKYFPYCYIFNYMTSHALSKWLAIRVKDYDIVHIHSLFSNIQIAAYQACQRDRIPYIIHPHGMLDSWALSYKSWKKLPYYFFIERPAIIKARNIIALAVSEELSLKKLDVKTPISVIPNGVWASNYLKISTSKEFYEKFPLLKDKKIILFLGRIDPKKGLDLLVLSFSEIHKNFPKAHLVIAGPDSIGFKSKIENSFRNVGCFESVTFTGMVTGTLKESTLAASTIYILPSYSEGFSISVLEGMASGLPCIITTGCNFPEASISSSALIVNPDHLEIYDALSYLLKNPNEAIEMGKRAQEFIVKNYSWESIAAQMEIVYRSILYKSG